MFEKIKQKLFNVKAEVGGSTETHETTEHDAEDRFIENAFLNYGLGSFAHRHGSYDNTYPNIARIAEAVAEVLAIAVDANGRELTTTPHLLDVLQHPNKEMSGTDFIETLTTLLLVHPKVYLLAWRKTTEGIEAGGDLTLDNIAGLTFMEGVAETVVDGVSTYRMNGRTFTEKEVLTLSLSVNPYNLNDGYSPSVASKKWANTDDAVAEYQNAQFRNGAVPAGMFIITTPTVAEFDQTVDAIQAKFRGATKANNVMYVHRPANNIDGKPEMASIEWQPFAQTNKELTLQAIYDQANLKIDMTFGVPEEIKGHLSNSNYASAEVADYVFSRRVVYPKLVKIYSKLTHEFNRIFGGMGFALSFNYEMPMLTDTRKLQAEALKTMIETGFTVESSVAALQLPQSYQNLKLLSATTKEQKKVAEVAERTAEDSERKSCEQLFLSDAGREWRSHESDAAVAGQSDVSGGVGRRNAEQSGATERIVKETTTEALCDPELYDAVMGVLLCLTDLVKDFVDSNYRVEAEDFSKNCYNHLSQAWQGDIELVAKRGLVAERFTELIKQDLNDTAEILSQITGESVSLQSVITAEEINRTTDANLRGTYDGWLKILEALLEEWQYEGATKAAVLDALDDFPSKERWRATRYVFTERQTIRGKVQVQNVAAYAKQNKFRATKTWHTSKHSPHPCPECIRTNGETVEINQPFSNGKLWFPAHPNCYCYLTFDLEPLDEKTETAEIVKINCPKCGRYICETSNCHLEKIICPNTKCKARLSVTVRDGDSEIETLEEKDGR